MAKYRHVYTNFWEDSKVVEKFTPEDRYFYLYLLTNPHTTQIGIYRLSKKVISFEIGYTRESVDSLLNRFVNHHKLIKYNDETNEVAIKNWGKYNLTNSGKPIMDLLRNEINQVEDISLLEYIYEAVGNDSIKALISNYIKSNLNDKNGNSECGKDVPYHGAYPDTYNGASPVTPHAPYHDTYHDTYHGTSEKCNTACINTSDGASHGTYHDASTSRGTSRGQNEKENENENENENEKGNVQPVDNSLPEINHENDEASASKQVQIPFEDIVLLFNNLCTSLPKVTELTEHRKELISNFWLKMNSDLNSVKEYFGKVEKSDFLTGRLKGSSWTCYFDWLLNQDNFVKVKEGVYKNKENQNHANNTNTFGSYPQREYDFDELEKKLLGY